MINRMMINQGITQLTRIELSKVVSPFFLINYDQNLIIFIFNDLNDLNYNKIYDD